MEIATTTTTTTTVTAEKEEFYLTNDLATRSLPSEEALEEYFAFRKEHDITGGSIPFGETEKDGKIYCGECSVLGVANLPLLFEEYRKKAGFTAEEMSDAKIADAAADNQLMLIVPVDDKLRVFPIRYTAYPDVLAAAGINGWLLNHTVGTKQRGVLDPQLKADWVQTGLHLNFSKVHCLVRDGKVEHLKSDRYQVLPEWDGYGAVKDFLKKEYPDHKYICGEVSHEYLSCIFDTADEDGCLSLKATLKKFGVNAKEVKFCLRYQTSEVGNASMKLIPIFDIDGVGIPLGSSVEVRHDAGNSVEMFSKKFVNISNITGEAEEKIEELGNTSIKHIAGCFQHIAEKIGLPAKAVAEEIAQLEIAGGETAIDVYIALVRVVENLMQSNNNISSYVKNMEAVTKTLSFDYKAYDKPVEED